MVEVRARWPCLAPLRLPVFLGLAWALLIVSTDGCLARAQSATGALRGTVRDKDFGTPLAQVRVSVVGASFGAVSSPEGTFLIEGIPEGSYTLSFYKEGYERRLVSGVNVAAGQLADLSVDLSAEVIDMDELVVTGTDLVEGSELGLLEVRAAAVNVQDAISAEVIRKAGASDVAGALKFVVGTSVVGGKYATVRGLSDRYTGTTLNGVRVPSADPRRRAVQVDLFPTGTVDSVTVTKTFTPDLQGDFTGGGVDIRTRSIPEGLVLSGSFGIEYNSEATDNRDFLTYHGGGVKTWGFAGGDRDLPHEATESLPPLPGPTYSATEKQVEQAMAWDRLVRSFRPVMGVSQSRPEEARSFSLVGGNRFSLGGEKVLGVLGALTYLHKYDFYENGQNNGATINDPETPLTPGLIRRDTRGVDEVLVGALASALYQPSPRQAVGLRLVANQGAEDEARFQVSGSSSVEQNQSLHYTERSVGSLQLHGNHELPEVAFEALMLDWVTSFNLTRQDEPDVRFFRNRFNITTQSGGAPSNSTEPQNTRRIFRDVAEDNVQGAFNASMPFTRKESAGKVKLGLFWDLTDRDYGQRSFTYLFFVPQLGPLAAENQGVSRFQATSPNQFWTDVFLDAQRIGLVDNRCPVGQPADSCAPPTQMLWYIKPLNNDVGYAGDQRITALYAMAELPLSRRLLFVGGARYETTTLSIMPVNPVSGLVEIIEQQASGDRAVVAVPEDQARASIDDPRLLPSLGLVVTINPQMKLRLTGSRTVARPTFRELAPVATEEFIFGDEFVGNPNLRLSDITNYDARWEWFRKPGEVLAASVFYKKLRDPIELISFASGGRSFIQPVNYERGEVRGYEVEARLPLGGLWEAVEGVTVGANYSYIDSEVEVPPDEQESLASFGLDEPTRRLQGQPEYLLNANVSWDDDKRGRSLGLFYNVVGETLQTGAARGSEDGVPNVFEKPSTTLDFSFSQKLPQWAKDVSLVVRAKNLLREDRRSVFRTPDGAEVIKTLRDSAVTYGASISVNW